MTLRPGYPEGSNAGLPRSTCVTEWVLIIFLAIEQCPPAMHEQKKILSHSSRLYRAADIDHRINGVKGIGAQRGSALQDWRRSIEADARSRMPRTVSWQDQSNIKSKYAAQKATLESQLNRNQEDLRNQEAAIRAKYAGLRMPLDVVPASEHQKHQAEVGKNDDRVCAETWSACRESQRSGTRCDS